MEPVVLHKACKCLKLAFESSDFFSYEEKFSLQNIGNIGKSTANI